MHVRSVSAGTLDAPPGYVAGTTNIGEAPPPRNTGARRQGRYVLGDLLGRGGMAEVFAGNSMGSHGFQKPVAIKRLLPELANDEVFVERLIGEAKLLVGMQHGNIVSVLDLARDGDDVFLVMEFVDGPSLRQLLRARGARGLSMGVATYVTQAAAAGLEFAHARPGGAVIHADISPSNLLLTTSGEVRVADFGIARREGGGAGVVEGKWAYMAPEQARGESLTPRSDVFALGVVLYELITGQHPLGRQVTADERGSEPLRVIPPRVVKPDIPPGLDAICMRALAYAARDRYGRMQQLIDALVDERFANGWREGASDLAQAIREIAPGASAPASVGPRTQVTDRPVTIVTRSLISQPGRASSPKITALDSVSEPSSSHKITDAARTSHVQIAPLAFRVDGTPPEVQRLSAGLVPAGELISVHGGNTVTGAAQIDLAEIRSHKWTFAVLGIAALLGAVAAIGIQFAPDEQSESVASAQPIVATAPQPRAEPPFVIPEEVAPPKSAPAPTTVERDPPKSALASTSVENAPVDPMPLPPLDEPKPVLRKSRAQSPKLPVTRKGAVADATLIVRTEDLWAFVYVGNQRKDTPPNASFKLPAGTYRVVAKNTDDGGIVTTCSVTLEAGKVKTLMVVMQEQRCYE